MKKIYSFQNGADLNKLDYVYSPLCEEYKTFRIEERCIVNATNPFPSRFDYISLIEKTKRSGSVTMTARCSFESYGAPLLLISNDIRTDENGKKLYGELFEVVVFEKGCNVWRILPQPYEITVNSKPYRLPITPVSLHTESFEIAGNTLIDLQVEIVSKTLKINVNGRTFDVTIPQLPDEFFVGFTACEGINRFYEFTVDEQII